MGDSAIPNVEQVALLRQNVPGFAGRKSRAPYASGGREDSSSLPLPVGYSPVQVYRSGPEISSVVSGEQAAGRARRASPRPVESRGIGAEPRQEDISEIRDRVTISAEAYAETATRYETYDRFGNLSFVVHPLTAKGSAVHAQTIRDQVTLVMKPPPGAVRRGSLAEPAEILVWFSANPAPEPA